MRIVVTGGREFNDQRVISRALRAVHEKHGISCLIAGGARGADINCQAWAERQRIPVAVYRADWNAFGKRAGILRNQQMIDEGKPEAAVAFPGGRGTADMVRRLKASGIPVWEIEITEAARHTP